MRSTFRISTLGRQFEEVLNGVRGYARDVAGGRRDFLEATASRVKKLWEDREEAIEFARGALTKYGVAISLVGLGEPK